MQILRPLFLGILAAAFALILEIILAFSPALDLENIFNQFSWLLILFVLIEETVKFLLIRQGLLKTPEEKSPRKLFYQTLFFGCGFALAEIALTTFFIPMENIPSLWPLIGTAILHIETAGLIGYLLLTLPKGATLSSLQIIGISFALHFAYNALVIYSAAFWPVSSLLLVAGVFLALIGKKFLLKI